MTDLLMKLLDQLNSSVFVLLGILVVTAWGLFKMGAWREIFRQHDDKICKIEGLAEKVVVMGTKVDLIYQLVNPNRPVAAMSPISLTDVGKQIAANINAESLVGRNRERLIAAVETENPKNAYDIQMAAMKVSREKMLSMLNESELLAVKQEAYNRGLLVEDVLSVFGVLLRNMVLEKKGIPIADVDRHVPKQA